MSEILEKSAQVIKRPPEIDALPISPQIQSLYKKNLQQIQTKWDDTFLRDASYMTPDGKGNYGKYDTSGKRILDKSADYWTLKSNEIIEQSYKSMQYSGVPEEKLSKITTVINAHIRGKYGLDGYEKYIRIEALVLAYATDWDNERKRKDKTQKEKPQKNPFAFMDM